MLIDLLVGLAIGAIVLGAAIACLLVAREAASAVGELSLLQQQTSQALRALGLQIRPAGSVELQAGDGGRSRFVAATADSITTPVVHGSDGAKGASDSLRVARTSSHALASQQEDCLGHDIPPGEQIEAGFEVDAKGALRCKSAGQVQPLVNGVAAFRLRYRVRQGEQVRDLSAGDVEAAKLWPAVVAVEVCLDLQGDVRASAYEGRYTDCQGQRTSNGGWLHLVTRKLFLLQAPVGG